MGASSAPKPPNQGHWSATSIGATPHRGDCLFRLISPQAKHPPQAVACGSSLDPSWRCCTLGKTDNMRLKLFRPPGELPGNRKGWGFPRKQASLFFGKSPAFSLCACAQAGRQSRPARERHVFVSSATAVHSLGNKSYTIRNGWGPGRIILPGGVWGSAPAFSLLQRDIA